MPRLAMDNAGNFRNGREFAAWMVLVPRQIGTRGRIRQLGISKRGDTYWRTLLMHGARSIIATVANKRARTIWTVLVRGKLYEVRTLAAAM